MKEADHDVIHVLQGAALLPLTPNLSSTLELLYYRKLESSYPPILQRKLGKQTYIRSTQIMSDQRWIPLESNPDVRYSTFLPRAACKYKLRELVY